MKNMKFILGFSVFGFLLSIFSSFRTVARSMGTRFVIAIGFALVFACLAFAIQFVLSKFVTTESYAPSEEGAPVVQNSGNSHPVDIVIQDEDLPSEENDAQFFVGSNHQMLTDEDLKQSEEAEKREEAPKQPQPQVQNLSPVQNQLFVNAAQGSISTDNSNAEKIKASNAESGAGGFVPLNLAETAKNISGTEAVTFSDAKKEEKVAEMNAMPEFKDEGTPDSLDVLPDLEDISGGTQSVSRDAAVVEDSDFSEGRITNSPAPTPEEVTNGKDAELMAKAISTLLAKE